MTLLKELFSINEGRTKEYLEDLIIRAIDLLALTEVTYEDAIQLIIDKVMDIDRRGLAQDQDSLIAAMVKQEYRREDHDEITNEDAPEPELPRIISKADKYSVELHENEQVKLFSGNQVIATMPLVIWKQLTR